MANDSEDLKAMYNPDEDEKRTPRFPRLRELLQHLGPLLKWAAIAVVVIVLIVGGIYLWRR